MTKQQSQPSFDDINENIYSTADLIARIALFTTQELNHYILSGNYVVLAKTLDLKEVLPNLPKGWRFQYITRLSDGHWRQLVILPTDRSHQRIWNTGLYAIAEKAGLTDPTARIVWAKWRNVAKFEYLSYLIMMLNDGAVRAHYLEYDPEWTYPQYQLWRARIGFDDKLKTVQRWDMLHLYHKIMRIKAESHQNPEESPRTDRFGRLGRRSLDVSDRPVAGGFQVAKHYLDASVPTAQLGLT